MFRIFYAENDAALYESAETANTGLDELLEIGKQLGTDGETLFKSRSIVKFDMSEINATLSKYSETLDNCKFVLQLYTTHAKNLPSDFTIDAKLVGQPWINGTGFSSDVPTVTNGIQWAEPMQSWSIGGKSGSLWISSSQNVRVNNSSIYVSGSGKGGSWYYQSGSGAFNIDNFNQSFFIQPGLSTTENSTTRPTDITMDVTDAIKLWINGSGGRTIANNGFILKFSDADEENPNVSGVIRYFSRETHTIYVPRLVMYFDNSTFNTGALAGVNLESYTIYSNVKPEYNDNEITKIRLYSRDKYPQKSPTNLFPISTVKYLPSTTYYTVLDAATDEVIIPYDDIYTKVSCDSTSNFIHIDMNGFMPERYYRIKYKIVDGFTEQYIIDSIYFKVVR
jgi:hypothetical protein